MGKKRKNESKISNVTGKSKVSKDMGKSEWQKVDGLVKESLKQGKIYRKSLKNTQYANIRRIKYDGTGIESWTHQKWLENSVDMLDLLGQVEQKSLKPKWEQINFRHESDFRGGIFSAFSRFWIIAINTMATDKIKALAYKMVHTGLSVTDNQVLIEKHKPRKFRNWSFKTIAIYKSTSFKYFS